MATTPTGGSPHSTPASTPSFAGSYTCTPTSSSVRVTDHFPQRAHTDVARAALHDAESCGARLVHVLPLALRWSRRGNGVTVRENAISRRRLTRPMDIAEFRAGLTAWLDAHHDELAPTFSPPGTLDDHVAQMQRVKSVLFEAGWMRWGWPERVGGLGGSPMLRTELGAALAARDLTDPGLYSLVEVLAPTLIDFASPELAAEVVPATALGRGGVVPGVLGTGLRQRLGVTRVPRGAGRTGGVGTAAGSSTARRSGPAWRSTPTAASSWREPDRPSRATAASPRSSSTWTARGSPSLRSR